MVLKADLDARAGVQCGGPDGKTSPTAGLDGRMRDRNGDQCAAATTMATTMATTFSTTILTTARRFGPRQMIQPMPRRRWSNG